MIVKKMDAKDNNRIYFRAYQKEDAKLYALSRTDPRIALPYLGYVLDSDKIDELIQNIGDKLNQIEEQYGEIAKT